MSVTFALVCWLETTHRSHPHLRRDHSAPEHQEVGTEPDSESVPHPNEIAPVKVISFKGSNFTGRILANIYVFILSSQISKSYTRPTTYAEGTEYS